MSLLVPPVELVGRFVHPVQAVKPERDNEQHDLLSERSSSERGRVGHFRWHDFLSSTKDHKNLAPNIDSENTVPVTPLRRVGGTMLGRSTVQSRTRGRASVDLAHETFEHRLPRAWLETTYNHTLWLLMNYTHPN